MPLHFWLFQRVQWYPICGELMKELLDVKRWYPPQAVYISPEWPMSLWPVHTATQVSALKSGV